MGLSELLYESAYPMNENLTAIRQRAEAALIGPWENDELLEISGPGAVAVAQVRGPDDFPCLDEDADIDALQQEAEATAAFIAHARQDIPDLLDRIADLERALVAARTALERIGRTNNLTRAGGESADKRCSVNYGGESAAFTCLDKLAQAKDPERRISSGYRERILEGAYLCDACRAVQALTEIAGVGITGAEKAGVQP